MLYFMILCRIKCGESMTDHFRFILIHFLPRMLRLNPAGWLAPQPYKATSMKFLDQDDTSGQHKLEGWLYIVFTINLSFNEETSFIGSLGDEAFYLANFEWGWRSFLDLYLKLSWLLAVVSFYGPCSTWIKLFYWCGLKIQDTGLQA